MIINRYLTKEIFTTLIITTSVLLLIFLSGQMLSYLRSAANHKLAISTVLALLSLQIPVLMTTLLPISFFLSILLSFGKLYSDNEITVMRACGVNNKKFFRISIRCATIIMLINALLALYAAPQMEKISENMIASDASKSLRFLIPKRFNSILNNKWVFYAEKSSPDGKKLSNIFAAQEPNTSESENKHNSLSVIFSQGGYQKTDTYGNRFLVLTNGHRYVGKPGQKNYQILSFKEYGLQITKTEKNQQFHNKILTTKKLWQKRQDIKIAAELNARISMSAMILPLTIFAVPMSRVTPRQGRYTALIPAILFYILYSNLLFLGRAWLTKGIIPKSLGLWWVHVLFLSFALITAWIKNREIS